jgi:hypothetical protein
VCGDYERSFGKDARADPAPGHFTANPVLHAIRLNRAGLRPIKSSNDVRFNQGEDKMPCRICIQLEEAVAASVRPDQPSILLGLTEAATRNRARQKEEQRLKVKVNLEKHQRAFHKVADNTAL